MGRIQRTRSGSSATDPSYDDDNGLDMDTADRLRENSIRDRSMHELRDAEMDARNQPRSEVADYAWARPMSLDAPPPRAGMAQRWVRVETRNESDNLNLTAKTREGWRPRDPARVPECELLFGSGTYSGQACIRVGGLVLMEIAQERIDAKKRAIREQSRRQEQSVSMETTKVSNEGVRQGFAPIVRDEQADVTTGRRPRTLTD